MSHFPSSLLVLLLTIKKYWHVVEWWWLKDLLTQVSEIRDAATESESVVRDITRDIQSLDLAKKNLIASMNALKRFQMLGTSSSASSLPRL